MAADASSWVFSINPGSSAIFFSSASISADKFLSSVSSAAFSGDFQLKSGLQFGQPLLVALNLGL
jgi:hypothetical protein